jgi:Flp pilus assembly protein CpaB
MTALTVVVMVVVIAGSGLAWWLAGQRSGQRAAAYPDEVTVADAEHDEQSDP